ncbi:MAG: hypothetical protein GY948_04700 [Alphaproteobacteria bacterium]|nr:hypothetical protein [Alphaproteobacteria bacterium]
MQTVFKYCVPLLVLCASVVSPAHSEDTWKVLLEQQLLAEEKCKLNYLTDVSITEEAGGSAVKAKAHCQDKRSFDVYMQPGKAKFELSACKPTYC